jgi:hypothetical protein
LSIGRSPTLTGDSAHHVGSLGNAMTAPPEMIDAPPPTPPAVRMACDSVATGETAGRAAFRMRATY